jgi:hypothetical protein
MAREARLTVVGKDSWYFLHAKMLPTIIKGALTDDGSGNKLLGIIELYAKAFECDLAGIFISKYHYALVVKFRKFKVLHHKKLLEKATALYEGKQERFDLWDQDDWSSFNDRIFNVGEFMRSIQLTFALWSNHKFNRKGSKFWADRFKSTILTNDDAALDALLYVESGAIREKDSNSLYYKYSSFAIRSSKNTDWLMPIEGNLGFAKNPDSKFKYKQRLNHRLNLPVELNAIVDKETKKGYKAGCYLIRQSYFLDGLVIGTEKEIQEWIDFLRNDGRYTTKTKPFKLEVGNQYSIREQRSHSVAYR